MNNLIFSESPEITISTVTFINVPTILQYEDTPLIEVVKTDQSFKTPSFTTEISIYDMNGVYLAKVKGSRLFTTEAGKTSGLNLRYPKNMTVCELEGRTLFEIRYNSPVSLSTSAELFTPDGSFIKTPYNSSTELYSAFNGENLTIRGVTMRNVTISDFSIGIKVCKTGRVAVGIP